MAKKDKKTKKDKKDKKIKKDKKDKKDKKSSKYLRKNIQFNPQNADLFEYIESLGRGASDYICDLVRRDLFKEEGKEDFNKIILDETKKIKNESKELKIEEEPTLRRQKIYRKLSVLFYEKDAQLFEEFSKLATKKELSMSQYVKRLIIKELEKNKKEN